VLLSQARSRDLHGAMVTHQQTTRCTRHARDVASSALSKSVCGNHCSARPFPSQCNALPEVGMTILKWALFFFVISVIAGILGFTGISAASADVSRILFYVFLVIFLLLLVLGLTIFRS
jgi:uncharacterized membrane protein YtjA (UPF0391 family)